MYVSVYVTLPLRGRGLISGSVRCQMVGTHTFLLPYNQGVCCSVDTLGVDRERLCPDNGNGAGYLTRWHLGGTHAVFSVFCKLRTTTNISSSSSSQVSVLGTGPLRSRDFWGWWREVNSREETSGVSTLQDNIWT